MVIAITALFLGFCLDLIIGDPHSFPHPIRFIGNLITFAEKMLRKFFPKTKNGEITAGFFLVLVVIVVSAGIPLAIILLVNSINPWLSLFVQTIMCYQILATKCLKDESMKVYFPLKKKDTEKARTAVSMIVGRDTSVLDDEGIAKATVETIAENSADGVIAPMIYTALGGPVLGFAYKAINTMDSMVAYKNEKYINFGKVAAKLDDIANYIPARLGALLMVISAFICGFDAENAFKMWLRDKRKHASPNSAQTEAAMAGALKIQLAGDAIYHGKLHKKQTLGDAHRKIEIEDIIRANKMLYVTSTLCLVLCMGLFLVFNKEAIYELFAYLHR